MPKNATNWSNNVTKNPTAFTGVAKTLAPWSNESVVQNPYTYDSPTMTYDSAVVSYDFLNPQANQANNLNPTPWSAT